MLAPASCTASTIGARRSTFSRVSTQVIPGEVRPSGQMHDEPWMIRPTPWRALSTKCRE
jgi:hypothetical protein